MTGFERYITGDLWTVDFPSIPLPLLFNGGNLLRNLLFIEGSEVFNLCKRGNLSPESNYSFLFFFFLLIISWKRNVRKRYVYTFCENNLSYCSNGSFYPANYISIEAITKSNFNEMCVLRSENSIEK